MTIVKTTKRQQPIFIISDGDWKEEVSLDGSGYAEVSDKAAKLLVTKYESFGFQIVEAGEELKVENVIETEEKEKEENSDPSLEEVINSIEEIDGLKAIATELGLPKEEWEGYRRKDYFKNYLIAKISEEEKSSEPTKEEVTDSQNNEQ